LQGQLDYPTILYSESNLTTRQFYAPKTDFVGGMSLELFRPTSFQGKNTKTEMRKTQNLKETGEQKLKLISQNVCKSGHNEGKKVHEEKISARAYA
jgi:hypothetical protein